MTAYLSPISRRDTLSTLGQLNLKQMSFLTTPLTTLINTHQLAAHLNDSRWILFDCRHDLADPNAGYQAYLKGHIPNAHFLHLDRDLCAPLTGKNGRHPLPDIKTFTHTLVQAGVSNDMQVIAYDAQLGMFASRLWWMLRWLGHEAVAVLDGGLPKWLAEQRTLETTLPKPTPKKFIAQPQSKWVDAHYVLSHLNKPNFCLIDARSPERYRGENEIIDPVAGHIPGALNRFYKDNVNAEGCFKSATELHAAFSKLIASIPPDQVVHQCGSGVSACHNLLAMEIAGLKGSKLYPGSWSEWCADSTRPTVTPDKTT